MHYPYRRVFTGVGSDGRSRVLFDDANGNETRAEPTSVSLLWQSKSVPADNSSPADMATEGFLFEYAPGATKLMVVDVAPTDDLIPPEMHATNTLDYLVIVIGKLSLYLEDGEVEVGAGDVVINRGNIHGWRNKGAEHARMIVVGVDAAPVGSGATV
ncbi:MAG: cupin domain-containing protein [Novosphingobium sp.]